MNKNIWRSKSESPNEGEWILCRLNTTENHPQPYKVWKFTGHDGLVTGNYPKSDWEFCNYSLAPILQWAYLRDIEEIF